MKAEDRVAIAFGEPAIHRDAYLRKGVEEGERYEAWSFAPNAEYVSPYWTGDEIWNLGEQPIEAGKTAIMEAKEISLVFPDWKIVDCQIWPSDDGFVMKNKWVGTKKDGVKMWCYSYTFARTNEQGQITRWETHVDENFGPFIEAAIGERGPWRDQSTYMNLIARALEKAGVSV